MSGIKEDLHAAPLTQGEWNQLFHGDEWERHPTHCVTLLEVARIRATIDNGGFAAAEPTDDEINEGIAKALGWNVDTSHTFVDQEGICHRNNCFTDNLDDALEAAAELNVWVSVQNLTNKRFKAEVEMKYVGQVGSPAVSTLQEVARWIATKLYEHATDAGRKTKSSAQGVSHGAA